MTDPRPLRPSPEDPTPATETGAAVDALVAAVHRDIARFCGLLEQAAELATALSGEAPGVNGLPSFCNGAADQLATMVTAAQKEAADVERKFTGRAPREPMFERVDTGLVAAVTAARSEPPEAA